MEAKFEEEDLIKALAKLDTRFDKIIELRDPLEKIQAHYINQAIHGGVDSRTQSLAQSFVNIGEGNFARQWRELVAMDMAFFDEEWLQLEETPDGTSEPILMDELGSWLTSSLQKAESNFLDSLHFAKLQSKLLGIGAIAYSFCTKIENVYQREFDRKGTSLKRGQTKDRKLVYQGAKAEWLDMRNVYLDTLSPVNCQINDKDIFMRQGINIDDLLDDETYDPQSDYPFDDFCIYRDNKGVSELAEKKPTYELGYLESETKYKQREVTSYDNHAEVRTAVLKRFKVGETKYKNVIVTWIKDYKPIPLKIEECRHRHRPVRLFTEWVNPFDDYGKTQLAFNYNASEWSNFLRSSQALAIIKSLYPPLLVPEEVISSISESTQQSTEEVQKLLQGHPDSVGQVYTYKAGDLNQVGLTADNAVIDLGKKEASQIIPLIQNERAELNAEMQNNVVDLGSSDVSDSTAKGVGYVERKQSFLAKQNLRELSQAVLIPFIEMTIEDLASMFVTEKHGYKLSESQKQNLEELNPELQFLKGKMGNAVMRDFEQNIQLGGNPEKYLRTKINTKTGEVIIEITAEAWQSFAGQVKVLIENNQYSLAEKERWADKLTQLTATLPEDLAELKAKLTTDLTIQYLKLGKFETRRDYDKYLESGQIDEMSEAKAQERQLSLQQQQAEIAKTSAEASKAEAEGKEEASRAIQQMKNIEKDEAVAMIAESEANMTV